MLPKVALEIIELAKNPDTDIDAVVKLLESDPVLAGRLLKVVQSALYSATVPIRSLRQAVIRLGLNAVRDLVFETAVGVRMFVALGYTDAMERLRRHSLITAHTARLICRFLRVESGQAFLCGLLHDLGTAGCLMALADVPKGASRPPLEPLWPLIHSLHENASALIARQWKLPAEITNFVGQHHQLILKPSAPAIADLIAVAESIAGDLGAGIPVEEALYQPREGEGETEAAIITAARNRLGLAPGTLDAIRDEATELLKNVDALR